ncbi:tetratricopeptide repeat protein [Acetobacter okinawensis]|uniref:tetratricopeptide repeat protein n=1 Tax=Acetobacter okinawensis TaxID=1076594 RepID=UPI0006843ECA|nr:tetratricopeptide repeat protein [Acetobacter okinawensis]
MEQPADVPAIRLPKGMTVEGLWAARQALMQNPTPDGLKNLATQIFAVQQYVAGERLVLDVIGAHQDNLAVLLAAADVLATYTMRYDLIVAILGKVLLALPHLSQLKVFLATALVRKGDVTAGMRIFAEIMQHHPEHHQDACEHLVVALLDAGYAQEGLMVLESWFRGGKPVTTALLSNMGCVLQRMNRSEEALVWYRRALEREPQNSAACTGYAVALFKAGHFGEGAPHYLRREGLAPDSVSWYLSLPHLRKGEPLQGKKVIFYQEQGLGDTLQFIRYLPWCSHRAHRSRLLRQTHCSVCSGWLFHRSALWRKRILRGRTATMPFCLFQTCLLLWGCKRGPIFPHRYPTYRPPQLMLPVWRRYCPHSGHALALSGPGGGAQRLWMC